MWSRRKFLRATSAGGLLVSAPSVLARANIGKVDTVIVGGTFHTMDNQSPGIQALAIRGKHIVAVGSIDDIKTLTSPSTRIIDAHGLTVTPGFIDSHSHPLLANSATSVFVGLSSISQVQAALRKGAAQTPAGHWVVGSMYDDTKFTEGRSVNRADLDAVSTAHPIMLKHRGGHTGVVNGKAFEVAGITIDTPNPSGGHLYRLDGKFTGRIAENALGLFAEHGVWPQASRASNQDSVRLITQRMAAAGLTSTTDAAGNFEGWQAYQDSYRAGEMNCRVSFMPSGMNGLGLGAPFFHVLSDAGIQSGYGNDMLRVGAAKFAADGSASERTMRMSSPYNGRPDDYGIQTMSQEQIDAAVNDAVNRGFRIGIHANGDVTIDMVLNAYERVLANWQGKNPRFRIEHCSLVNPSLIKRIKATGSIPTPFYTYAHYHGEKWHEYGTEKMESMFAHKSFIDAGIPVAPASDYTPGPFEPMMALQSLVTRKDAAGNVWGASQKLTVAEAMQVCTMNGAYASFEENLKGSLTPGKLADIVLLEQDPFETEPDSLKNIKVNETILGGNTTFQA
jgi:predicted amidohydrolase YtcJ